MTGIGITVLAAKHFAEHFEHGLMNRAIVGQ